MSIDNDSDFGTKSMSILGQNGTLGQNESDLVIKSIKDENSNSKILYGRNRLVKSDSDIYFNPFVISLNKKENNNKKDINLSMESKVDTNIISPSETLAPTQKKPRKSKAKPKEKIKEKPKEKVNKKIINKAKPKEKLVKTLPKSVHQRSNRKANLSVRVVDGIVNLEENVIDSARQKELHDLKLQAWKFNSTNCIGNPDEKKNVEEDSNFLNSDFGGPFASGFFQNPTKSNLLDSELMDLKLLDSEGLSPQSVTSPIFTNESTPLQQNIKPRPKFKIRMSSDNQIRPNNNIDISSFNLQENQGSIQEFEINDLNYEECMKFYKEKLFLTYENLYIILQKDKRRKNSHLYDSWRQDCNARVNEMNILMQKMVDLEEPIPALDLGDKEKYQEELDNWFYRNEFKLTKHRIHDIDEGIVKRLIVPTNYSIRVNRLKRLQQINIAYKLQMHQLNTSL